MCLLGNLQTCRGTTGEDRALLKCLTDCQTDQAETPTIHARQEGAIRVEIKWLLAAGFIKEVYHPEWLANPVLVQKKNKEWRMCVDYTNLKKHCPKDPFGLSWIEEVVDSTVGCEMLSFLDCYSCYHQISHKEEDQIKTSFIMPFDAYCYTTMSFGLKNARATYPRAI